MKATYLEYKTWPEAEELLKSGRTLVIPLGARLKEHGLHLPLNNDWLLAEHYTQRVAEKCDVIIAPTIQHNYYPSFVEYPGSVHISAETSKSYVKELCDSFIRHGVQKIYILNLGISTLKPLARLKEDFSKSNIQFEFTDLRTLSEEVESSVSEQECGTHADEIETSMMLYIAEDVVKLSKAKKDIHSLEPKSPFTRDKEKSDALYSPTGAWGDPTLATKEKGQTIVEAHISEIIQFLDKY